jgi:DNA repair exonuclease SbcCD ATPase subunit
VLIKELLVALLLALATSELGAQDGRDPLSICRRLYLDCDRDRAEWLAQGSSCACPEVKRSATESTPLKPTKQDCSAFLDEQENFMRKMKEEMEMKVVKLLDRQSVLEDKLDTCDRQRKGSEDRATELHEELAELQMVVKAQWQVIEEAEGTSSGLRDLSPNCPSQPPCVCNATVPVCQCQCPDEVRCANDLTEGDLLRELSIDVNEAMKEDRANDEKLLAELRNLGKRKTTGKSFTLSWISCSR